MNSRIFTFCLILFAFLSINMTCNESTLPNDDSTVETTCIDKSKINPNQVCPRIFDPVCGCNGKSYTNPCEAEKAGVTKWEKGKCDDCIDKSKIDPEKACIKIYKPVCGCDGNTYSNECEAEKAGLKKWKNGKCKDQDDNSCIDRSKINPNKACPRNLDPVCGCNGKTYSNSCEAEKAGVTKWEKGKCEDNNGDSGCIDESKIDPDGLCMKVYQPVCGCDNKTYGNACEATKAGVTKWADGPCKTTDKDGCIDRSKINNKDCPDVYEPVCGCNGRTYPNACSAENSGVTKWVEGKCQ